MLYTIAEALASMGDCLFALWFIPKFLHTSPFRRGKRWTLLIPVLLYIYELIADRYLGGFNLLYIVGCTSIELLFALVLCEKKWVQAVFAALGCALVFMFAGSLLYSVFTFFLEDPNVLMQGSRFASRLLYLVIGKVIHYIFFQILLSFSPKQGSLDRKKGLFLCGFSVSLVVGQGALMAYFSDTLSFRRRIALLVLVFVLLLSNFTVYIMLYQVQKLQREEYERRLFLEKMKEQTARAGDAAVIWDNIRRVRHDLKNHFSVLRGLLETGDTQSCLAYLDELSPTLNNMGALIRSGNAVIDYLINTKLSALGDVRVIISGYVGNYSDIADPDLAGILGNLLDNAVEAVERLDGTLRKSIELHFLTKNQNRIILCRNTTDRPVLTGKDAFRSSKKEGEHGLGHKIVETIAKKYGGFVEYIDEEQAFSVQVILPMQAPPGIDGKGN